MLIFRNQNIVKQNNAIKFCGQIKIDQKKQQMQQKNAEEAAIKQQKASKQVTSGLANGVSSSVQMGMRRMPMQPTGGYDNGMDGPEY